jgi:transcription antitermination factor NusG
MMAESLRAAEAGMVSASPEQPRWYACYTRARHEKQVDRLLRERGFESFLPLIPRVSQWKDRRRLVEWPLFPSYVFGRFGLTDAHTVLAMPGVASLVRTNGRPAAIGDEELANVRLLLTGLATGAGQPEHRAFLAEGDWVEVMDGPFRGLRGIVAERRNRRRVLIGIREIGQGLEVDIETSALRPVARP